MVKRAILNFGGASPILRVSKPGVAVDGAAPTDLMLDERVLYSQVYSTGFFARANVGNDETINVSIGNQGFIPYILTFPVDDSKIVRPTGYNSSGGFVSFWYVQTTNTSISFVFQDYSSITSMYYQVLRIPRN